MANYTFKIGDFIYDFCENYYGVITSVSDRGYYLITVLYSEEKSRYNLNDKSTRFGYEIQLVRPISEIYDKLQKIMTFQ